MLTKKINYLKAIEDYEKTNQHLGLLISYLNNVRTDLPTLYCEGKIYLTSYMLIKKLYSELSIIASTDNEFHNLLRESINCSKLFYSQLLELIKQSHNNTINFELEFEHKIQPLGQKFINLLKSIKFRLLIIKTKSENLQGSPSIYDYISLKRIKEVWKQKKYALYQNIYYLIYKTSLVQVFNHTIFKKAYYFTTLMLIAFSWVVNFTVIPGDVYTSMLLSIIMSIVLIVFAIISYPVSDFGKIDISGKNFIAYKYKAFLNNLADSKLLQIFTI